METIEINKENLLKALNKGSESVKEVILALFPELSGETAQKPDNRHVTERIKTVQDALDELGEEHPLVAQYSVGDTLWTIDEQKMKVASFTVTKNQCHRHRSRRKRAEYLLLRSIRLLRAQRTEVLPHTGGPAGAVRRIARKGPAHHKRESPTQTLPKGEGLKAPPFGGGWGLPKRIRRKAYRLIISYEYVCVVSNCLSVFAFYLKGRSVARRRKTAFPATCESRRDF